MKFQNNRHKVLFAIFFVFCFALEIYLVKITAVDLHLVVAGIILILMLCNFMSIILYFKKKYTYGILIVATIALLLVPYQIMIVDKKLKIKEESANIANYIFLYKIKNGNYPEDINEYEFKYPALNENINYKQWGEKGYMLFYYVGYNSTMYNLYFSENSKNPYWEYYD